MAIVINSIQYAIIIMILIMIMIIIMIIIILRIRLPARSDSVQLPRRPAFSISGVHKGGFSKGGFGNDTITITHKLLSPLY